RAYPLQLLRHFPAQPRNLLVHDLLRNWTIPRLPQAPNLPLLLVDVSLILALGLDSVQQSRSRVLAKPLDNQRPNPGHRSLRTPKPDGVRRPIIGFKPQRSRIDTI